MLMGMAIEMGTGDGDGDGNVCAMLPIQFFNGLPTAALTVTSPSFS